MISLAAPVIGALCLVLGVIAVGVRLLKGRTVGASGTELPMEVVGRVGVGPRQGLVTVRVADRLIVVSVGDGGVHPVCELDDDAAPPVTAEGPAPRGALPRSWQRILRSAGAAVLALGLALGQGAVPTPASAQTADPPAAAASEVAEPSSQDALGAFGDALPDMQLRVGGEDEDGLRLSGTVGTVLVIGLLTMLPTLLLLMTSFTRVLVVLHFLRQALGTQTAPPAQLIAALALLLTGFVMAPTLSRVNTVAIEPWMDGQMDEAAMLSNAADPFRDFMASHVRESDLATFIDMGRGPVPETIDDVPLITLVSAFAISELRTAFQIGFVLFLPFLIIDLVVAAVLMSLGMFMLPPVMVSLPFKLLLFVLVDGWALVVHSVVASFG
jgi:flagellar biosynthetic protein FliP